MQLIGFNFIKISGERKLTFEGTYKISPNIEITNIEKDELEVLKGQDLVKISFRYTLSYTSEEKDRDGKKKSEGNILGQLLLEGMLVLSSEKEGEFKEMIKKWKKKETDPQVSEAVFTIILQKCIAKIMELEENLGLPIYTPPIKVKIES